ncbi:TetR/AcrR family transcriptional regulator [Gulosibacter faecalis]|uniref:TetR/AcrR family transcriptional regulator n=1 Tax=Gulosibacter faecalis TaxID=272240 RepID=A0ABW5UV31_9MICO|nr:TetR family transcriptional regulator [Gulosibacter faecalis]
MPTNRDRILTAAIDLLADGGIRRLTHLQIDERAGLPRGSTSNAFRTRAALLAGVTEHMLAHEVPEVDAGFAVATPDEFAAALAGIYRHLTGSGRAITAARLALMVEAAHDEAIRDQLAEGRRRIEARIRPPLVALGTPDVDLAVQLIATTFEGLFLHELGGYAWVDAERVLTATVRAIFAST